MLHGKPSHCVIIWRKALENIVFQRFFMGLGRQIWGPGNQVGLSLI